MLNSQILFFVLIIAATALEILADIFFKQWADLNRTWLLILGLALYSAGTVFWAFSLRQETLSRAISIFTLTNLIIITLVGVYFFKEDLSLLNKVGILLGIASIVLIELK